MRSRPGKGEGKRELRTEGPAKHTGPQTSEDAGLHKQPPKVSCHQWRVRASQEVHQDQERHLADLQALKGLVNGGVRSMGASYRLVWLRRKYPVEYAHLRDIEISSR